MAAINCILHPHHVSLSKHHYTLSSILNQFQDRIDPYYEIDGGRSHRGLIVLKFDVCEGKFVYHLYGEVPGVKDKQGSIKPEGEANEAGIPEDAVNDLPPLKKNAETKPVPTFHNGISNIAPLKDHDVYARPRQWLHERQIGEFERSFTFLIYVELDEMKATLADGLLKIVVPKKLSAKSGIKRIPIL